MIASSEAKVLIEIAQKRIARVQIITQPPPSPAFFPLIFASVAQSQNYLQSLQTMSVW